MRKSAMVLAVAAVSAVGLVVGLNAQTPPPAPPYRTVTLDRGPVTSTVRASGTLSPERQVALSAATPGVLTDLLVNINSPVRGGDVLAKLDATAARDTSRARAGGLGRSPALGGYCKGAARS